jgi:hypothetical protein
LHADIRAAVTNALSVRSGQNWSAGEHTGAGDVIFAIDRVAEERVRAHCAELAEYVPFTLICEGLGENGEQTFPAGADPSTAQYRIVIDPIDGTRGLLVQKRPGWILTGVAPSKPTPPALKDINCAVMTEIPLHKQHLTDSFWAGPDGGVHGERVNRLTGATANLKPQPSDAASLEAGFCSVVRFFQGGRVLAAAVEEMVIQSCLGEPAIGATQTYEDQYASTGGQLYNLMVGQDRWIADIRPLINRRLAAAGRSTGHCCHPYDLAAAYVAHCAGVVLQNPEGGDLDAPLDVKSDVAWTGYANDALKRVIAPELRRALEHFQLMSAPSVGNE